MTIQIKPISLTILLSLLLCCIVFNPAQAARMQVIKSKVYGMTCQFCAYGLKKKLSNITGVEKVKVSLGSKYAIVYVNKDYSAKDLLNSVKQAIINSGYTPKTMKIIHR